MFLKSVPNSLLQVIAPLLTPYQQKQLKLEGKKHAQFYATCRRWERWQKARPFLSVSHDLYSRSLIEHMLVLLDQKVAYARASCLFEQEYFDRWENIKQLLIQVLSTPPPPPHRAPPRKASHTEAFLFVHHPFKWHD